MTRVRVAAVGEVPAGEGRVVEAAGRALALFNVDGAYHCLDNVFRWARVTSRDGW